MKVYRGCGGLSLKIPVSNAQIFGCLPIGSPLIKLWYAEIADRCAFTVHLHLKFYLKVHKMDQFFLNIPATPLIQGWFVT